MPKDSSGREQRDVADRRPGQATGAGSPVQSDSADTRGHAVRVKLTEGYGHLQDELDEDLSDLRSARPTAPAASTSSDSLRTAKIAIVVISILAALLLGKLVSNEITAAHEAQLKAGSTLNDIMPDDTPAQEPPAPSVFPPGGPNTLLPGTPSAPVGSMQPDAWSGPNTTPAPLYQQQPPPPTWNQNPSPPQSMQPAEETPAAQPALTSPYQEPPAGQAPATSLQPGGDEYGSVQQYGSMQQGQGYAYGGQSQQVAGQGQSVLPPASQVAGQPSYSGYPGWPSWALPPLIPSQSAYGSQQQGVGYGAPGGQWQVPVAGGGSMQPQ